MARGRLNALMATARLVDARAPVKRVVIVGGTHGNEATGVAVARALAKSVPVTKSFSVEVVLANTAAIANNTRYVEEDMNRCFSRSKLSGDPTTVDGARSREINALLGPKASPAAADLVIDIHNTTSASGVALLMARDDALSHAIGAHLVGGAGEDRAVPRRVCEWAAGNDHATLPSIGKSGFTLEVGPVSWGVVDGALFAATLECVLAALAFVERRNAALDGAEVAAPSFETLDVYRREKSVPYPRDGDGAIAAFVHPDRQFADFAPHDHGAPLFRDAAGNDVGAFDESEGDTIFFVNEAAYYEKDVALCYASKHAVSVERLG